KREENKISEATLEKGDEKFTERSRKTSDTVLREVLEAIMQRQRSSQVEAEKQPVQVEAEERSQVIEKQVENKILELAQEAYKRINVKLIECDKHGVCVDGKRIGEVFEDSKGLRWQRGFLNTSRLPIFIDYIAEEAKITGRVGKAFIIVSSRDAKAIIPDDYICEATSRYGILINLERCSGYKVSPWSSKSRKKEK
ncbi:MAG: hypothetical protein QXW94_05000, partial [Desulfurococcaceae archaeon]